MAFGHLNFKPQNMVQWFKRITGDVTFAFSPKLKSTVAAIQGTTVSGTTGSGNVVFSTSPTLVTPALGTPASGNLASCTFPTLNQNTTGSAASLSISGQSGLMTVVGLASTSRIKTVRDAADTLLELGGSYTPSGTWTNLTMVTPALGTPASGVMTNVSGTAASLTAGNATKLATARAINGQNFDGSAAITVGNYNLPRTTQTTTYAPTTTDNGSEISFAGASANATWTIVAGATNGAGWWCRFNNPTLFYLTIKVTTNTIDGIAGATGFVMYPGEVRDVYCNGTNYFTTILKGFVLTVDVAASPFTFTVPPGYQVFDCEAWGGGGGGGTNATGGGGGGGGYACLTITAATMGSTTQTVTIGAGGGAGANQGGNTTIGSLLTAYGGGGTNATAGGGGGGGGGITSKGANASTTAGGQGGAPNGTVGGTGAATQGGGGASAAAGIDNIGGGGGSGGGTAGLFGGNSIYGGGGGGGGNSTGSPGGGSSVYGGGGGSGNAGVGGTSVYGGVGGTTGVIGTVPGGGGGRNAAGGAGRCIIRGTG